MPEMRARDNLEPVRQRLPAGSRVRCLQGAASVASTERRRSNAGSHGEHSAVQASQFRLRRPSSGSSFRTRIVRSGSRSPDRLPGHVGSVSVTGSEATNVLEPDPVSSRSGCSVAQVDHDLRIDDEHHSTISTPELRWFSTSGPVSENSAWPPPLGPRTRAANLSAASY